MWRTEVSFFLRNCLKISLKSLTVSCCARLKLATLSLLFSHHKTLENNHPCTYQSQCTGTQHCWMLQVLRPFAHPVACCCAKFETGWRNIVGSCCARLHAALDVWKSLLVLLWFLKRKIITRCVSCKFQGYLLHIEPCTSGQLLNSGNRQKQRIKVCNWFEIHFKTCELQRRGYTSINLLLEFLFLAIILN